MFKVGQEVVCINDKRNNQSKAFKKWVVYGKTYTIRASEHQGARVLLEEIVNPKIYNDYFKGYIEPGFASNRFVLLKDFNNQLENLFKNELSDVI